MAKRKSEEELREEITRLAKGIDCFRDWEIERFHLWNGADAKYDLDTLVEPGSSFLDMFEEHGRSVHSFIIKEMQSWYSHTASDLQSLKKQGDQALVKEIGRFLTRFKNEVGFDFFSEAGLVRKIADKVLIRGKLVNQEEWYLLKEVRDDVSQSILSENEVNKISDLMAQFEGTA